MSPKLTPDMNIFDLWNQGWDHACEGLCASDKEEMQEHRIAWEEMWDPEGDETFQQAYDAGVKAAEDCYAEIFEARHDDTM